MSTRVVKVFEFLTAKNVTLIEFHRRLKVVYGDDTVDSSTHTVNPWMIKFVVASLENQ